MHQMPARSTRPVVTAKQAAKSPVFNDFQERSHSVGVMGASERIWVCVHFQQGRLGWGTKGSCTDIMQV
jgi:hypothetical protein